MIKIYYFQNFFSSQIEGNISEPTEPNNEKIKNTENNNLNKNDNKNEKSLTNETTNFDDSKLPRLKPNSNVISVPTKKDQNDQNNQIIQQTQHKTTEEKPIENINENKNNNNDNNNDHNNENNEMKEEIGKLIPNEGNGSQTEFYSWTQNKSKKKKKFSFN